jgi:hypothetical protein
MAQYVQLGAVKAWYDGDGATAPSSRCWWRCNGPIS